MPDADERPEPTTAGEIPAVVYVIEGHDGPPEMAFLDRDLANRWAEATGNYGPEPVEITTAEPPPERTWYQCRAGVSRSVHIITGTLRTEIVRRPVPVRRRGDGPPDEHSFGTPEEALAHCRDCPVCDAAARSGESP